MTKDQVRVGLNLRLTSDRWDARTGTIASRREPADYLPNRNVSGTILVSLWIQLRIYSDTLLNGSLMFTTQAGFIHS